MKPNDRARLTAALRDHVANIAADLRTRMRAPGFPRLLAEQLHKDERVAEDYEVWTDLLARRASVLWALKSVYVRVLEDRGLLAPGRLLDPEAQQLFERLAPHLGETAFLRWIYRDLASSHGGLPELFSTQPAEVALPSDDLSRSLIEFWRHRDADTDAVWSFAEEHFEGELMGDLYQELDPVVKDRFALCQTPDFVRAFILDRTLTPAIETFGADKVRLLDPACGSGHFLIDGLKRLVAATAAQHPDWDRLEVVRHALDRVVGIDLNDYACALARARLIMTAAELADITRLADAARFHPHVYWADALEQVEREEQKPSHQHDLFDVVQEQPRATLTRSGTRAALKMVFATKFHAVVANPPYITEKDPARKAYHRESFGARRRYLSAYREYSLGSPFTERCFQLAEPNGYVGLITSNNFMKREFGKPLIKKVLRGVDLSLVVDTSQTYIPHHGTPTVLLFGRNRRPEGKTVRAVMSKRGENGTPVDPATARVWSSILAGWKQPGFQNEYISIADLPRETMSEHPWSLGGGGAAELKERLERSADERLGKIVAEIGAVCMTRADEIYFTPRRALERARIDAPFIAVTVEGDRVRNWAIGDPNTALFPYDTGLQPVARSAAPAVHRFLWPYRTLLWLRREPNGNHREIGLTWWEWSRFQRERFRTPLSIAFAEVATHNHFVLDRGGKLFKQTAPVIKLPLQAAEAEHLALVGLLNCAAACFWMKQVFHNKAGSGIGRGIQPEPWMDRYQYDSTKMRLFPVPANSAKAIPYADRLSALAHARSERTVEAILSSDACNRAPTLRRALDERRCADMRDFQTMVALQEELDWLCYNLYGIDSTSDVVPANEVEPCLPTWLPWTLNLATYDAENRAALERGEQPDDQPTAWFARHGWEALQALPENASPGFRKRIETRIARTAQIPDLALMETAHCKRRWYKPDYDAQESEALAVWLADQIEEAAKARARAFTVEQVMASLQNDPRVLAVGEVLTGRKDFSLSQLILEAVQGNAVPNHRFHLYKPAGLVKREVWERTWADQRREDAGEQITPEVPPVYASSDFLKNEYWQLRGKLDIPKERFIALTETPPTRPGTEALYGWSGWTPTQRLKALLAIDEDLEDSSVPLADRMGLLDSAWRLLPEAAREDEATAARLKAELQALLGPAGPSHELIEEWRKRFPPRRPSTAHRASPIEETQES